MKNDVRLYLIIFSVVFLLTLKAINYWNYFDEPKKTYTYGYGLEGIDISHHQGNINWKKVSKSIDYVYIKATEGTTIVDKNYKENVKGASKYGIPLGSYHYFTTLSPVETQAKNFLSTIDLEKQDLVPMIDIEDHRNWNKKDFIDSLTKFLNIIEQKIGQKPILYTFNTFYNKYLANHYKNYYFYVGRYGKNKPFMKDKSDWYIWQYTQKGKINGIKGYVDKSQVNRKLKLELIKYNPKSDMKGNKKAVIADVNLRVRVVIDEEMDMEGPEFDHVIFMKIRKRMLEEGVTYIAENIEDYDDDIINPYDPEFDADE